jgi:hypothetical protein
MQATSAQCAQYFFLIDIALLIHTFFSAPKITTAASTFHAYPLRSFSRPSCFTITAISNKNIERIDRGTTVAHM